MRILLILIALIIVVSCSSHVDEKETISYKTFLDQFLHKKRPIEIDSSILLNNPNKRNWGGVLLKGKNFLYGDSILYYKSRIPGQKDSIELKFTILNKFGKLKIHDSLEAVIINFMSHSPKYSEVFRMELFLKEKLINSFNIAASNYISLAENDSLFVVTSSLLQNQIKQYKVAIKYYEKQNKYTRVGGEDYYFTFGDTLATSVLTIQPDGSIIGNNLVEEKTD